MTSGVAQIFNDPTLSSLKMSIDAAAARQTALASNIANVNTPGYHRVDLSGGFKASLDAALHQVDQGQQAAAPAPSIVTAEVQNQPRFDGNTVHLDDEMTELIKNQSDFDFSARMMVLKYSTIKSAISGTVA